MRFLKIIILLFIVIVGIQNGSHAMAQAPMSAVRKPYEDYRVAAKRYLDSNQQRTDSAYAVKKFEVDISKLMEWDSSNMQEAFQWVRDERFLETDDGFRRRSSWLYPYDGCFARAELAGQRLMQKSYAKPSKIFVFGGLEVQTQNAPGGSVSWWYHVVIGYKKDGVAYIFDPAIDPKRPLTLQEWSDHMGADPKEFSICDAYTHTPDDSCDAPNQMDYTAAKTEQGYYLQSEWQNLIDLGRDPERELGDNPPWLN